MCPAIWTACIHLVQALAAVLELFFCMSYTSFMVYSEKCTYGFSLEMFSV